MKYFPCNSPFDFTRAVFYPFHVGGADRGQLFRLVLLSSFLITLTSVVIGAIALTVFLPQFADLAMGETEPDTVASVASIIPLFIGYILMFVAFWVIFAMTEAAFHRFALKGERIRGWRLLRLDGDTGRVMLAHICVGIAMMLVMFAAMLVMAILAGLGAGIGAITGGEGAAIGLAMGLVSIGYLGVYAVLIWAAIHLAPAASMSVYSGKFQFLSVWNVAKGKMWPMTGAYLVVYLLQSAAQFVLMFPLLLGMMLIFLPNIDRLESLETQSDPSAAFEIFTTPTSIIAMVLMTFIFAVYIVFSHLWMASVAAYASERVISNEEVSAQFV